MGDVYRARDASLQRDVAIKVLPAHLSENPDARARFEREARAVAALSHPNIMAIHEFGLHDRTAFAVMELLEGDTLRQRLSAGSLPLRKVVDFGVQIARGLAAAHDKGVVHRDLKPDNLFVTKDGQVKILDFGLARQPGTGGSRTDSDSPTMARLTSPGTVMGTTGYMSPEQVRGAFVDHRSDIFSFGAVLYEMASGRRAFEAPSAAETMTAIVKEEPPPLSQAGRPVSPALERIVSHCLEKDREGRFQSALDLAFDLASLPDASGGTTSRPLEAPRARTALRLTIAATAIVALGAAFVAGRRSAPVARSSGGSHAAFSQLTDLPGAETAPRLSPDGKTLLFVSRASGNADIYLQRVGGHNPINITKDCPKDDASPAFSPDGERIAFRSECEGGGVFLMGATGESKNRLTDFGHDPSWSPDARKIVVATEQTLDPLNRNTTSTLWVVDVATGERLHLTQTDATQPAWSPHGQRIAFWGVRDQGGQRDLWTVAAEGSATPTEVTNDLAVDWNPVWSPDGRTLYFSSGRGGAMNLWRLPIDESSGRVLGNPEPLTAPALWGGDISLSRDGRHLAYATREPRSSLHRVAFDPVKGALAGPPSLVLGGSRKLGFQNLSPDGQWLAFTTGGLRENLCVIRTDGTGYRQITDEPSRNRGPAWSSDGKGIVFYSDRSGHYDLWTIRPDGSGLERLTATTGPSLLVPRWSPDGSQLIAAGTDATRIFDNMRRPIAERQGRALPPIAEGMMFQGRSWSPDGSRLAGYSIRSDGSFAGMYAYTLATNSYEKVADVGIAPVWLSDGRRMLYATPEGALALLDIPSRESRELLPSGTVALAFPASCSVSKDEHWISFQRDTAEGDVWLMTLE